VETSLLNGRTFRSLEHLNEVARWWLANVADLHVHGTTKRRPLEMHAEELPHLLVLPAHDYDTSRVVYRLLEEDGFIRYQQNEYSAPWRYVGRTLPVRITADELIVYNLAIEPIARHALFPASQTGQRRSDASHRPPRDVQQQLEVLRQRFAQLGETGVRFLDGLLAKHRHAKALAQKVLLLARCYHQVDVVAAMQRAIRYQAFSFTSLERILAAQAQPKPTWPSLADGGPTLDGLGQLPLVPPRSTADYQHLLSPPEETDEPPLDKGQAQPPDSQPHPPARERKSPGGSDPRAPGDTPDSADGRTAE
jgi:hypothetical protein